MENKAGIKVQKKILLVDDEPDILDILSELVETLEFTPATASNAQEALAKATKEKPDLIVLDIKLPDLNGVDVCDMLKHDPQTAGIPIIFLTALDDREVEMNATRAGGRALLTKPCDPVLLTNQIRKALSNGHS